MTKESTPGVLRGMTWDHSRGIGGLDDLARCWSS